MIPWVIFYEHGMKIVENKVLTIGCAYETPKGGVAQMLSFYHELIFKDDFLFIPNSGTKLPNLLQCICALGNMLLSLLRDRSIRIVHIHTASYLSFYRSVLFLLLGKLVGCKVIMHIHGGGFKDFYYTSPRLIRLFLRWSDGVIVLSEAWAEFFSQIVDSQRIYVVPNIVPRPAGSLHPKKKSDEVVHILFLGLINKDKGIYDLLEVLDANRDRWNNRLHLHIGGNGETQLLEDLIRGKGLSNIVTFEGWVAGEKKEALLSQCDVFCLPSYIEGLPVSILESMAYGQAILSTTVGSIPEAIVDNGILISPGDKEALAFAIDTLLQDRELLIGMQQRSLELARLYNPDSVSGLLERLYSELLSTTL